MTTLWNYDQPTLPELGETLGGSLVYDNGEGGYAIQCYPQRGQEYVNTLVQFKGQLFGGMGEDGRLFRSTGAATPPSTLMVWSGGDWSEAAEQFEAEVGILTLQAYGTTLYAGSGNAGKLLALDGVNGFQQSLMLYTSGDWTTSAYCINRFYKTLDLTVFNDTLFAGTGDGGLLVQLSGVFAGRPSLMSYTATDWEIAARFINNSTEINGLVEYNSKMYAGSGSNGRLYEWSATSMAWTQVAGLSGTSYNILCTLVFNGELYGGGSDDGALLKWDGVSAWTSVFTSASYTGVRSMAVYDGRIFAIVSFAGTGSYGQINHYNGTAWATATPSTPAENFQFQLMTTAGRLFYIECLDVTGQSFKLAEYVGSATETDRSANYATAAVPPTAAIIFDNEVWVGAANGTLLSVGLNGSVATAWTTEATLTGATITSFAVHNSKLYCGTNTGSIYEWNGTTLTEVVTPIGDQPTVSSMISFNGSLYAGLSVNP